MTQVRVILQIVQDEAMVLPKPYQQQLIENGRHQLNLVEQAFWTIRVQISKSVLYCDCRVLVSLTKVLIKWTIYEIMQVPIKVSTHYYMNKCTHYHTQ